METIFSSASNAQKSAIKIIRISGASARQTSKIFSFKETKPRVASLRKILSPMGTTDAMEFLLEKLKSSKNNEDFFSAMNQ